MCIKDVVVVVLGGGGYTWFELVYMCARVCVLRAFVSYYNIFYLEKKNSIVCSLVAVVFVVVVMWCKSPFLQAAPFPGLILAPGRRWGSSPPCNLLLLSTPAQSCLWISPVINSRSSRPCHLILAVGRGVLRKGARCLFF